MSEIPPTDQKLSMQQDLPPWASWASWAKCPKIPKKIHQIAQNKQEKSSKKIFLEKFAFFNIEIEINKTEKSFSNIAASQMAKLNFSKSCEHKKSFFIGT
jgi:hypothetical protein